MDLTDLEDQVERLAGCQYSWDRYGGGQLRLQADFHLQVTTAVQRLQRRQRKHFYLILDVMRELEDRSRPTDKSYVRRRIREFRNRHGHS